jgi:hypothetical protein
MRKWVKMMVGVVLLPACAGGVSALGRILARAGESETFWIATLCGAACWLVTYLLLPKPMRLYVFGHELTHVVWTWLFGGEVKRFKAAPKGGRVVITKSNFLIALAPYFFPLYAVLVILLFFAGDAVWDWTAYRVYFHWLLGAAYAFHVTLTGHILRTRQTDITEQGYFFSGVIILLGNLTVLLIGLPLLLAAPNLLTALQWWLRETGDVLHWLAHAAQNVSGGF